jgi:O-antigen/teichoic acid export membrane protein
MWWRFGFDVLFVVLLVGFAWVLIPKRGALGLAAAYGFAYACTSLVFFSFISKARGVALVPNRVSANQLRKSREY